MKGAETYTPQNDMVCGERTVYVNKGNYFGGNTYLFSSIENITSKSVTIRTGKFVSDVSFDDLSVALMRDKIEHIG